MPVVKMPNGDLVSFPDDMPSDGIHGFITEHFPDAFADDKPTLASSFMRGAKSGLSQAQTYGESLIGSPEEAAAAGLARQAEIDKMYPATFDMQKIKDAYNDPNKGVLSAALETAKQAPYALAEQLPFMGAMAAGASGAAALAPEAAVGILGARALGAAGAFIPSAATQVGSNIERQAEVQKSNNQPIDINMTKAQLAGAGQGAIDVATGGITAGKALVGKLVGAAEKDLAKMSAEAVEKAANQKIAQAVAAGAAKGAAAEMPGEVTQQMLERWQAGLPLTDADALREYQDTAFQTLVTTAPLGSVGGLYDRHVARNNLEMQPLSDTPPPADTVPPIDGTPPSTPPSDTRTLSGMINYGVNLDDGKHTIAAVTPEFVTTISPTGESVQHPTADFENEFGIPAFAPAPVAAPSSQPISAPQTGAEMPVSLDSTPLAAAPELAPALPLAPVKKIKAKPQTVSPPAKMREHEPFMRQAEGIKNELLALDKQKPVRGETELKNMLGYKSAPMSLSQFVRSKGGMVDEGGEMASRDLTSSGRSGEMGKGIIAKDKGGAGQSFDGFSAGESGVDGQAIEYMKQLAHDEGFKTIGGKYANDYNEIDNSAFMDAVTADAKEPDIFKKTYTDETSAILKDAQANNANNSVSEYGQMGISSVDSIPDIAEKLHDDEMAQREAESKRAAEYADMADYEPIPFARSKENTGQDVASVKAEVANSFGNATANLLKAGKVVVVSTHKQLPLASDGKFQDESVAGMKATDGKVYVVANKVKKGQASGLLLHEVGVHVGMRDMIGEQQFNEIMNLMATSNDPAVVRARDMVPSDTPAQSVNEETLAYLVQTAPKNNIVQRLFDAIRAWVYKTYGKGVTLNEGLLRELAVGALRRVSKTETVKGGVDNAYSKDAGVYGDTPFYHGTNTKEKLDVAKQRRTSFGAGLYFDKNKDVANIYSAGADKNIREVKLSVKNPLQAKSVSDAVAQLNSNGVKINQEEFLGLDNADMKDVLARAGYDALDYNGLVVVQDNAQIQEMPESTYLKTPVQSVIHGAEPISDKQLAERKMDEPLRAKKTQQPMDVGIFDKEKAPEQFVLFSKVSTEEPSNILATVRANKQSPWFFSLIGNPWQMAAKSKIISDIYLTVKGRATYAEHRSHEYVNAQHEYREMPWASRKRIADYAREASGDMEILEKEKSGNFGNLTEKEISALQGMRKSFEMVGPNFVRAYAKNAGVKSAEEKSISVIQKELQAMIDKDGVSASDKTAATRALNASKVLRFVTPNYWPRIRTGDYWVNIVNRHDEVVLNDQMQSNTLANRLMRPLSTSPGKNVEGTLVALEKEYPASKGYKITHDYVKHRNNVQGRGLDSATIDRLMAAGARTDGDTTAFYDAMDGIINQLSEIQKPAFMQASKKIKGLPDQPHDDIIDTYTNMVSHIPARLAYEKRWTDSVNKSGNGKPWEQKYADSYVKYINQQDSAALSAIRLWTFYSAFSLRPLTPLANWGSIHTVAAPLMGQYMGTLRAHRSLAKHFSSAMQGITWSKQDGLIFDASKLKLSPALMKAIKNSPNLSNYNARDMQGKEVMSTMKGRMTESAASAWEKTAKYLSSAMGMSEQLARHQAFIASYTDFSTDEAARKKFMKKHGADHRYITAAEDGAGVGSPESMADWVVQASFFDAGKMNHSPWERGWLGIPTQFKGYGYKLLSTQIGLFAHGGMQGKLTAAILLGSALTMSGMAGAPEVDDIEKLWKLIDPNVDFRTTWRKMLQNDMGFSQYAADAVINGAGNLAGVPIGRQFSQSSLLPNNADLSALLGPSASLTFGRINSGLKRMGEGQPLGAAADFAGAIPGVGTSIRNAMLATTVYPEEGVQTATGKTVIPAGQVTAAERARAALGISSPRITQEYDQIQAMNTQGKKGEDLRDSTTASIADLTVKRDNANKRGDRKAAMDYEKERIQTIRDYQAGAKEDKSRLPLTALSIQNGVFKRKESEAAQLKSLNKNQKPEGRVIQGLYK